MKKSNTVSKHDILREIKDINKAINGTIYSLDLLMGTFKNYLEFKKDEEKFTKFLNKKFSDKKEDK
tara:strand:- start:1603 stop:1800 length:198 start_codon:yes stop_codon:yes gene_type:complete